VVGTQLIATHPTAPLGFVNVLELVAFATLEADNELVRPHLPSARPVEDRPVAPGALRPPRFLERAALGHVEAVE